MIREYLISTSNDVNFNLSLEEYLIRTIDFTHRELLLIYINDSAVVLGKNQNILKEVNYRQMLDNKLTIGRRISGGGTVIHDRGNINFSFFESHDFKKINSYQSSTARLVNVINQLGVKCYLNPRNAIFLENEKKISGSAQFSCSNGILSHFTILYDSDLKLILNYLTPNKYEVKTKASPSVSSTTDNLSHHLNLTQNEFINKTLDILGFQTKISLTNADILKVKKIEENKYNTIEYFYDLGCNGLLEKDTISIELEAGKIKSLSGINTSENYIGKRLLYSEIDYLDPIWGLIL